MQKSLSKGIRKFQGEIWVRKKSVERPPSCARHFELSTHSQSGARSVAAGGAAVVVVVVTLSAGLRMAFLPSISSPRPPLIRP